MSELSYSSESHSESHPEHPYLTLKLAQALFHKPPDTLDPAERKRVDSIVSRQLEIEQCILATSEAAQVVLPQSSLNQALAEVKGRYPSEEEFRADLARSGLSSQALMASIERDLKFEAVLDRIGSMAADVSETDIEIFYLMHKERFRRPENRTLRHILVTINDTLRGNERLLARRRIDTLRTRLLKSPSRFAELALKHSECPTAMNGGLLGRVTRGQLFPELEPTAFSLPLGELSAVVESPMGFHIIHCVAIEDSSELPLAKARQKIREHLVNSRRQSAQKEWVSKLMKKELQES